MGKLRNLICTLGRKRVVQNGIWLYLLEAVNTVLPFLTIPYITRILSTSGYGEFSLALNWISYLEVLVGYGFTLSATRKMATLNDAEEESRVYSCTLMARGFLCLLSLAALGVFWIVSPLNLRAKIAMLILFMLVFAVAIRSDWVFNAKQDMKIVAILGMIGRTVTTILCFLFVKTEADLYLYCFLYVFTPLVSSVVSIFLVRRKYNIRFRWRPFHEVWAELKDGWYTFISEVATKLFGGFGLTYMGYVATTEQAGIYSAIHKIAVVMLMMWSPVSQVCYPYISKVFGTSWKDGLKIAGKTGIVAVAIFALMGICLVLVNKPLVWLLFGEEYAQHGLLLIPMLWVVVDGIVNNFLGIQILTGSGHAKQYSHAFLIDMGIFVLLTLVLGRYFSMYGIAYAYAISELCLTLLLVVQVARVNRKQTILQKNGEK